MPARVSLLERMSPLAMGLWAATVLVLLAALALVKATLNECRAETAFRRVLRVYGGGESDLAARELPAVIATKPRRYPHPRLMDALIRLRRGDLAGAKGTYEEILAERETMLTPREQALCLNGIGVAKVLMVFPKPPATALQEARDDFRKATETWPELPEPTFNLAALEWLGGRYDACRALLAESVASGRLPPTLEMAQGLPVLRASLAEQAGDWEQGVAQARTIDAYGVPTVEHRLLLARALSRRLLARGGGGTAADVEPEQILYYLDADARKNPRFAEAALNVTTWRMAGLWGALQDGRTPPDTLAYLRNWIDRDLGWAAPAAPAEVHALSCVQACRDLIRRAPNTAEPDGGTVQRALEALLAQPSLPDSLRASTENNLGCLLVSAGKPGEALAHLQKAVGLAPGDPLAARNLAVAMDRKGDSKEALAWYAQSLSLRPAQPDVESRWNALKGGPP